MKWKLPRITTIDRLTITPEVSEIMFDTDTETIWFGDGVTIGGIELGTGLGIIDGDKGDITVSGSGSVWTIDNLSVNNAKISDVSWSKITGAPSFITSETDPVWLADKPNYLTSAIAASTYQPLDGDLTAIAALAGTSGLLRKTAVNTWTLDTSTYLTSFTETDPIFSSSPAAGILSGDITNWNNAFSWGDHALAGYLTGSGTSGRVTFWSGSGTLDDSPSFLWDNVNERLTITRNSTALGSATIQLTNTNAAGLTFMSLSNDVGRSIGFSITGTNYAPPYYENRGALVANGNLTSFRVTTNGDIPTGGTTPFDIQPGGFDEIPIARFTQSKVFIKHSLSSTLPQSVVIGGVNSGISFIGTYTDDLNYQSLLLQKVSNSFQIGTNYIGSGTTTGLHLYGRTDTGSANGIILGQDSTYFRSNTYYGTNTGLGGTLQTLHRFIGTVGVTLNGIATGVGLYNTLTTTSGTNEALRISPYITGSGYSYLINAGTNSASEGTGTHTSKFVVNKDGYVGILNDTPLYPVHIKYNSSTISASIQAENQNTSSYANFEVKNNLGEVGGFAQYASAISNPFLQNRTAIYSTNDILFLPNAGGSLSEDITSITFRPGGFAYGNETHKFFKRGTIISDPTEGLTLEPSAIFDVRSTVKGFLLPRMLSTERTAIVSPATSLLVYQTDSTENLYIKKSTAWKRILTEDDAIGGSETDPIFSASAASGIVGTDITNWNTAFSWGNHASAGYLTSFTETDPTVAAHIKAITNTQITNWDTVFGWGNHATAGYISGIGGSNTQVQYNNGGSLAGAANVEIENDVLRLENVSSTANPAAGGLKIYSKNLLGGFNILVCKTPDGYEIPLQPSLFLDKMPVWVGYASGTTAPPAMGATVSTSATMGTAAPTLLTSNKWLKHQRKTYTTSTTAGNASGIRQAYTQFGQNVGGFLAYFKFGQTITFDGEQKFIGMCVSTTLLGGNPSSLTNIIGMGVDSTDIGGNWYLMYNDGSGTATKVNLGIDAARNTTDGYELIIYVADGSNDYYIYIKNITTDAIIYNGMVNTDIPASNTTLAWKAECRNGSVAASTNLHIASIYLQPL